MSAGYSYRITALPVLLSLCMSAGAATDPTRPFGYGEKPEVIEVEVPEESTEWHLNGVRIYGDSRSAILNGSMIREGDNIENATVLEINPTFVVLEQGDRRLVVRMLELNIKQPARAIKNVESKNTR